MGMLSLLLTTTTTALAFSSVPCRRFSAAFQQQRRTVAFGSVCLSARRPANEEADDEDEDDVLLDLDDIDDLPLDDDDDDAVIVDDDDDITDVEATTASQEEEQEAEPVAGDLDEDDDDDDIDELEFEDEDDDDDEEEENGDGLVMEEIVEDEVVSGDDWDEPDINVDNIRSDVEWDAEEDGGEYELEDDPDDPDYMRQKEMVETAIQASDQRAADEAFDPLKFITEDMTPEQAQELEQSPFIRAVEEKARNMELTEQDIDFTIDDLESKVEAESDLMADDPYLRHENGEVNILEQSMGLADDDMQELDQSYKDIQDIEATEPWDKVMLTDTSTDWDLLPQQTLDEIDACLGEIGGSSYNVTKWLLYDLNFNVTNLILAAVKHNRNAPILFQHWYPQLVTYERYKHAQERDFDFTWQDVENADISELERYYKGFGYDEIPEKAPAETGIISLEDLDEEEIKMAAFENWMNEVYNPEGDRKDFDDDGYQDEDNVFSEFYEAPQHPDLPKFEDAQEDIQEWQEELGDDPAVRAYRDKMGQTFQYEVEEDKEFEREFRGHLIIACTGLDQDLDIAEQITLRFEKEFGKKVFVETRVMALAREEDNVFEIWLESYDIELLHSKKRATSNAKGWTGPADVDKAQIDFLVDRVRFMISDDARYSYKFDFAEAE